MVKFSYRISSIIPAQSKNSIEVATVRLESNIIN